jgi:HEAT repeat protein
MKGIEEPVERLGSADEAERIYAAEDIGYANLPEGVLPLLKQLSKERSLAVREAIFAALQSIRDDAVIGGAIGLLSSDDPFLRNQAVELLRRRGARVIPPLLQAFPQGDGDERKLMLDVLAGVDSECSSEIYALALADTDVNVVITAVESLGNARKTEFRERVEGLAASPQPMLAGACLETLAQIGDAHSLEVVRAGASATSDLLLPSYLRLLGALGGAGDLAEVAELLGSRGAHLEAPILDAMTLLRQRHPSARLPEAAAEPLEHLVRQGSSPILRHQALRLLEELANHGSVAAFPASWRPEDERV